MKTLNVWKLAALAAGVFVVAGLCRADDAKDAKKDKAATKEIAHIRLHGELAEAPPAADALLGAGSENFKAKLDRIKKAQDDPHVQALFIQLDGLECGYAKINELRKAIEEFRKTGKKVYAFVEGGEAKDYLVASAADKVAMPASGWLMLVGTRMEIAFYKDLLEKLGIKADFLQMGVFKFAAEPLTRSKMSAEAQKQFNLFLDDLFANVYVGSIVRSRKDKKGLTDAKVRQLIDEGPYTASKAKEVGLIDEIAYRDDFEKAIKKELGGGDIKLVKEYGKKKSAELDLSNPFSILKLLSTPKSAATGTKKDRIALVYATGAIVTGKGGSSLLGGELVGSTTMIEALREADRDPKVKAIVLRIDSPGGSALASDLIWNEIKACKKPVVASMSDVAGSGGYYIAMPCNKIYAQPGTLTGSIGVVGGKIVLGGLFDKLGVNTEVLSRGKNSGILSSTHPFTPAERKAMEALMAEVYDQFLAKTITGRQRAGKTFTRAQLLDLAEGRIWTGQQALKNGLVDALGGLDDAIAEAKELGGLKRDADVDYLVLPKSRSFLDTLLEKSSDASLLSRVPGLAPHLRNIEGMLQLRAEPVWTMMPAGVRVR
jgi:protease-4